MLTRTEQPNSFLYIQSDVPAGLGLREWRREIDRERRTRRHRLAFRAARHGR